MDNNITKQDERAVEAIEEIRTPRYRAKDSVFTNLFSDPKNLLNLYQTTLYPERTDVTEADIQIEPVKRNIVRGPINPIAFKVLNQQIIIIDAQSSWKWNDILQFASCLFDLFIDYVKNLGYELFREKKLNPPSFEIYVVYTGKQKLKESYSLKEVFYPNNDSMAIDAVVKILTIENSKGILEEYFQFTDLEMDYYTNDRTSEYDIEDLIDQCIRQNILKEYLQKNRFEVAYLIYALFIFEVDKEIVLTAAEEQGRIAERKKIAEEQERYVEERKKFAQERERYEALIEARTVALAKHLKKESGDTLTMEEAIKKAKQLLSSDDLE